MTLTAELSAPSASLQMTPSWVVQPTRHREGMPSRETWTSSRSGPVWTSWGSIRPRRGSCTWVRATTSINTGWGINGFGTALLRETWGYWWMKSWTWVNNTHQQCRRPTVSASKEVWPAGWGGGILPLYSPASSSGALSTGGTWTCWSRSRRGSQQQSEGWNASPTTKDWDSWGCSACRREGCGETLQQPFSTWRGPTRKLKRDFLQGPVVTGQGIIPLN